MRRSLFLLAPLVASATVFACEDSSGGGSSGIFETDGAVFEASPGTDSQTPVPTDSGTDAPASGVSVGLLRGSGGVGGATVVFHDAMGVVLESKTTDATGKATSTPGLAVAQASILYGKAPHQHIITWTSVAAGDQLVARDTATDDFAGNLFVTTQGDFKDGGSTGLRADIGDCAGFSPAPPLNVYVYQSCLRPKLAIRARASDGNGNEIAYAFAKDQTGLGADGGGTSSLGPWLTPAVVTLTPSNVPAGVSVNAELTEIANDLGFENDTAVRGRLPNSPTSFRVAPGFADAYQYRLTVSPAGGDAVHVLGGRAAPATDTPLAYATTMPLLDSVDVTTTDLARPDVAWTTVDNISLATADGGVAVLEWSSPTENSTTWAFVVPPGAKGVKAPALPASAAEFLPTAADSFAPPVVTFAASDLLPDYAAFRKVVGQVLALSAGPYANPRAILPANGKIELTTYRLLPR